MMRMLLIALILFLAPLSVRACEPTVVDHGGVMEARTPRADDGGAVAEDDFSPGQFFIVVIFGLILLGMACIMLAFVAAGVTFALLAAIVFAIQALVGSICVAILAGIIQRRKRVVAEVFVLQIWAALGLFAGAILLPLAVWALGIPISPVLALLAGILGGLGWGMLCAMLFNLTWTNAYSGLCNWLHRCREARRLQGRPAGIKT